MRLTREEVYAIIAGEDDYSERHDCQTSAPPDRLADDDKPLELWLLWMEQYLADARRAATNGYNKDQSLSHLRCVLSIGVNAAMRHGLPPRIVPGDGAPVASVPAASVPGGPS